MCSEMLEAKICTENLEIQVKFDFFNFVPLLSKNLFEWVVGNLDLLSSISFIYN